MPEPLREEQERCAWRARQRRDTNQIGCCASFELLMGGGPKRPRIYLFCKPELTSLVLGSANEPVLTHHCFSVSHSLGKRCFVVHAENASEQVLGALCAPAGFTTGIAANRPTTLAPITEYLRMLKFSITPVCVDFTKLRPTLRLFRDPSPYARA